MALLKEAVPKASRIALFVNSTFSYHTAVRDELEPVARSLKIGLKPIEVRTPEDLDGGFAAIVRDKVDALMVLGQPMVFVFRARIAKLALDHQMPAIIWWREAVEAGLLMSYGDRLLDAMRRVPHYVDRILKGAKPADLPVEQPTTFYLTVNRSTAKALGLTIPPSLLGRADEVIQ